MTYLKQVEDMTKDYPEIPQHIIEDVRHRVNCWMQHKWATEDDNYLLTQLRYLNTAIENVEY